MEIFIEGHPGLTDEDWQALVKAIKKDFASHGEALKRVRKEYEEWRMIMTHVG